LRINQEQIAKTEKPRTTRIVYKKGLRERNESKQNSFLVPTLQRPFHTDGDAGASQYAFQRWSVGTSKGNIH
jgi:hypothetical protein